MFQKIIFWVIVVLFAINFFKHWGLFRLFFRIESRIVNPHSVQMILMVLGVFIAFYFDESVLMLFVVTLISIFHIRMVKAFERVNQKKENDFD